MNPNKSYRVRTTPGSNNDTKLNVTLNQEYDFIDILSLKLDQKNVYRAPKSEYGCIVGRVMANGGMGVPNARVSIFIPVTERTKMDINKRFLYPYDISTDQNYKNIRYNLFHDENINECHQIIGTFPLKRTILDNNDILEIFDEYYKYTTVTNNSGDYMMFGVPVGTHQVHCDVDLSDCGHLSQMPRDMYYKGYSVEQFESSTQFKKDTNLDNLAQVFSEDSPVYIYSFWGNDSEDEIGITRHDINIAYKFETTCVFLGSIVTDSDNATTYTSCLPQDAMGDMATLTTKQGTIEMVRLEPDGRIINYKIHGNQLIDGDGVWCYQIPMNLDYYTTDEFGNEVLSDNPSIGIPSRADVRFKISIEQPEDTHKKKACYLVPHNPNTVDDVDYTLSKDTKKQLFVSLFKNNVYSVKSYIPRMQLSKSPKTQRNLGIKSIQNHGTNLPFPYNELRSNLPTQFTILCAVSAIVIEFERVWNQFMTTLMSLTCRIPPISIGNRIIGLCLCIDVCRMLSKMLCAVINPRCMHIDPSWCQYNDILVFPGCYNTINNNKGCPNGDVIYFALKRCPSDTNQQKIACDSIEDDIQEQLDTFGPEIPVAYNANVIWDCVITTLAEGIGVSFFNFTNDWINGALYFPTFNYQKRKKKRRRFLGIFGKDNVRHYEDVCSYENEQMIQKNEGTNISVLVEKGIKQSKIYKICSPKFKQGKTYLELSLDENRPYDGCYDNMYERTFGGKIDLKSDQKKLLNRNRCHESSSSIDLQEPFINREVVDQDENGEDIYEYYYRPIATRKSPNDIVINLFKTDIILIGSLDICNKHGIWDLYKDLPITTYQMPGPMYELDFEIKVVEGKDEDEINWENSLYIASGKNWGAGGGRDLSELRTDVGSYRHYTTNNTGGLFYGIGCQRFETKIKTCTNLERICQLGVDLDIFMAIEGVCDGNDITDVFVSPQGFIGRDQLIRGIEIRQQFATLNQHPLNHYRLENDELKDNLISNEGKKYYNFEYVYPINFDGKLSGIFNGNTRNQTNLNTSFYNSRNESYIDPEYFYFRYGTRILNKNIALRADAGTMEFFQPINSFYFYFGIRSGSTAIEKLRQKFTAKCFQSTDDVVQMQVNVVRHPYICYCNKTTPNLLQDPSIKIEILGAMTSYNIEIKNSDGILLETLGNYIITTNTGPRTTLTDIEVNVYVLNIYHPLFEYEGTFFVTFTDDYGNISQSTFTLRYQNRVSFNLREVTPIFDAVDASVVCMPNNDYSIFDENGRGTCGLVILENITNIANKNCGLDNYQLLIKRQEINIGSGAIFRIQNGVCTIVTPGFGYKTGAYGHIGNGAVYIKVNNVTSDGGILPGFRLITQYDIDTTVSGYPDDLYTVEKMKMFTPEEKLYDIPPKYYNPYNAMTDEEKRDWRDFRLYLCEGEYSICLVGKDGNCRERDITCNFIVVSVQPGISLTFKNTELYAKYFRPQVINNITYTPSDNIWWDEMFKFLRSTVGKDNDTLFLEFRNWYNGQFDNVTIENVRSKIDLLKEMWMPTCSSDNPLVQLNGDGYYPPMRTLLYGAIKIQSADGTKYLLCASDTYNSLNQNTIYHYNDIPYQSQNSTLYGLVSSYRIYNDQNVLYTTPTAAEAASLTNNLTPENLVFTTTRIPIVSDANYRVGGFYAGVIGQNGAGRAGGYDSSLSSKIKDIQNGNPYKDVSAWELLYDVNGIINNWEVDANKYLFKFHILDQTLKIFKQWNRISAEHNDYYEPYGCTSRYIPPYFDVYYVNGPLIELTVDVENSEFDLIDSVSSNDIMRNVIPEIDATIIILENLGPDQDPPDGLPYVSISSVVADYRTHLGTCPTLIPNARHIYSTSRYNGNGGVDIEQRNVTTDTEGNEVVEVLCTDSAVSELSLVVENKNHTVSSYFNGCNVTNHYSHSVNIPNMAEDILNNIIGGNLTGIVDLYELYQMRYGKNNITCGGSGAAIHWRTTFTNNTTSNFWRFLSIRRRNNSQNEQLSYTSVGRTRYFNVLIRGNGYKINDRYSIYSDTNNNNLNSGPEIVVTGSVVDIRFTTTPPRFISNGTTRFRITVNINGGGIGGNNPSSNNPLVQHSNVGAGIRATFNYNNTEVSGGVSSGFSIGFSSTTEIDENDVATTYYRLNRINIPSNFVYGSGYITEPDIAVMLEQYNGTDWTQVMATQVIGKGVLGSNYFDVPARYRPNVNNDFIYKNEPATIPAGWVGAGELITGVGKGFIRQPYENDQGEIEYTTLSVEGALYSFAILGLPNDDSSMINILDTRGKLLQQTKTNNKYFRIVKIEVNRYDWMSDLFCNRNQSSNITSAGNNPEDLLYYMTTDDWWRRFNFPLYTKSAAGQCGSPDHNLVYANMNPRINEPSITCSESGYDDYSSGTTKTHNNSICSLRNPDQPLNPKNTLTLFVPFHGNIANINANSTNTMFYTILHDNETHVRAFSQPLDFGNYILINENTITYIPNPTNPDRYSISLEIQIAGVNAYKCYGYDILLEEGDFHTYTGAGSIDLQVGNGYDLFDTSVPTALATTGILTNGRWIKLEGQINRFATRIEGISSGIPTIKVTVNNFSSKDINKLVRISAKDVTGLEIYTYISLFRWIDTSPQITHCVYNCNKDLERALNTGIVIDFEWRDNLSRFIGELNAYVTRSPQFPTTASQYPPAILMQGKNLIHTNNFGNDPVLNPSTCTKTFNRTDGCTVLSDNETIPRNYRGDLYVWFDKTDNSDNHRTRDWLNNNVVPVRIEVIASSCYIPYRVIWN